MAKYNIGDELLVDKKWVNTVLEIKEDGDNHGPNYRTEWHLREGEPTMRSIKSGRGWYHLEYALYDVEIIKSVNITRNNLCQRTSTIEYRKTLRSGQREQS